MERENIEKVRKNRDVESEYVDKETGNKMFFNLVHKMRRMKGLPVGPRRN